MVAHVITTDKVLHRLVYVVYYLQKIGMVISDLKGSIQ